MNRIALNSFKHFLSELVKSILASKNPEDLKDVYNIRLNI